MKTQLIAASALLATTALPVSADPAVSELNGKFDILGGTVEGDRTGMLLGSFAAPMGNSLGFQLDGLVGRVDEDDASGLGAHIFWRDPGMGLFGVTASRNWLEGETADRAGVEGELYLNDLTLSAFGGWQTGDVDDETYYGLGAAYYINDRFRIEASGMGVGDDTMFGLGAEYLVMENGSLYLRGTGNEDNESVMVGFQITFGGSTGSLKTKHRYDHTVNPLFNNLVNSLDELRELKEVDATSTVSSTGGSSSSGGSTSGGSGTSTSGSGTSGGTAGSTTGGGATAVGTAPGSDSGRGGSGFK